MLLSPFVRLALIIIIIVVVIVCVCKKKGDDGDEVMFGSKFAGLRACPYVAADELLGRLCCGTPRIAALHSAPASAPVKKR